MFEFQISIDLGQSHPAAPSSPPLVLVLEDRWEWGVYMGVVHTCTHMCFIDAMEAYLKKGRGPRQAL